MKKTLKAISILCAAAMTMSVFAGCQNNNPAATSSATAEKGKSSTEYQQASADKAPTLVWWTIGTQPENLQAGVDEMNKYTAEKIGVKIDIKVASWGEFDSKMNTIVNSGENFDIMFTNNTKYNQQVSKGAFVDITDKVQTQAPDLYKFLPEKVWNGTKIGGKIFAVPTYKDSSITQYWVFDDKYVKKHNIDMTKIKTFQDLDKPFRSMKASEGKTFYPLSLTQGDGFNGMTNAYDDLTLGLQPIGVRFDDASRKVVSVLEKDDIMADLKLLHSWYKDGIINADAPTLLEPIKGRPFFSAQGFPGAEASWQVNEGIAKYDTTKVFGPLYTTSTIQGSLNAISANSKYPVECLKYLQLVNTDSKLRNMLAFGVEGKDFKYETGNVITKLTDTWSLPAYAQGTFFNMATQSNAPADQWDQVKALNEKATASTCLGFALDISHLTTEVANCRATWDKYRYELMTGASDPTQMVPKIVAELKASGMDKIIAEAQKQIDAYFK